MNRDGQNGYSSLTAGTHQQSPNNNNASNSQNTTLHSATDQTTN